MPARIDPHSGNLVDVDQDRAYTLHEIQRMTPPCPRCGTAVSVTPVKVESTAGPGPTDLYMIGRHEFDCRCFFPEAV